MKNIKTLYIVLVTLVIGLLFGWILFGKEPKNSTAELAHQHTGNAIWTCSMHPQIRQPESGQCPLCGMDLIPLNSESADEGNPMAVKMSLTAMQLANVQTSIVFKQHPVKEVRVNGRIKADERKVFSQSSHMAGRVEKLIVSFTGESVQKGQVLAYIYSPELLTAQEELFQVNKIKSSQPELYQAAREKLKNWKLTENQINQILVQGTAQEIFPILADVSGIVMTKKINLGDYIKEGQSIYEVVNLSSVWVLFDVYESDISWINLGDKVNFNVPSLPSKTFSGSISFIDPIINSKTRVASVRIEISNPRLQLKPEMFVDGSIKNSLHNEEKALTIPKSAVMWTGERSVVYVKNTRGEGVSFLMREVTLGTALGDSYVIKKGLEEGEEIATNGTFSIDAAAQLAGKPSMMNPEGSVVMARHNHGEGNAMIQTDDEMAHSVNTGISEKAREELKPLLRSYLKFKDALVMDDFDLALSHAKEMMLPLNEVNTDAFTGQAHHTWIKYHASLEKELGSIDTKNNIELLRISFKIISGQMVLLIKDFGAIDKPLYIEHCPMGDNGQGVDWISSEKEIKNPYFGGAMLNCGFVAETIE